MTDPTNIPITPADQRRAAELAEGCLDGDAERVGVGLTELLNAGAERALAVTAVLARNLAAALIAAHGPDGARRVLESTRLDAAMSDDESTEEQ